MAAQAHTSSTSSPVGHAVQFYDDDSALTKVASEFLAVGLQMGRPCVVVATPEQRDAIARHLHRLRPVDAAGVRYLDARRSLEQFMISGWPDESRFTTSVGEMVSTMALQAGGRSLHAFGEMVNCLCSDGLTDAAIELEWMWNSVLARHDINMLCGYRRNLLDAGTRGGTFGRVCACHREILPMDGPESRLGGADATGNPFTFPPVDAETRARFVSGAAREMRNPLRDVRQQLQAALRALAIGGAPDVASLTARIQRAEGQAATLSRILDEILSRQQHDG